jgi:hypothetical protein
VGTPSATHELHERRRLLHSVAVLSRRLELPVVGLWLALGSGLALLTSRVADWYVMTDELLYERLAMSVWQLHSPLPHIHGEVIGNVNQLYPLLLAPVFQDRLVPGALHDAHVLNAFVMSSACVPAFLLARRVTRSSRLAYLVAALSVCIPWIALSSFLMTEVVGFPVFLWTVLALQQAVVSPRVRNDLLLIVALALATLARTQFAVFLLVVPLALLLHRFVFAEAESWWQRIRVAARGLVTAHRVLTTVYAGLAVVALVLVVAGRLSSALGTYSVTAEGDLLPSGMPRSLLEHLAPIGLGMGIVPFVVGVAWLLCTFVRPRAREQHAFACIALLTVTALLVEVTSYDLRFGAGRLHDRYLFYVVPLILIGFAAMLREERWRRWALLAATSLLALAFAYLPVNRFDKFNVDSPVALLNNRLLDLAGSEAGAQLLLGLVTLVAGGLALFASAFLRRRQLVAALLVVAILTIPAQAGGAFAKLFTVDGASGRPLTLDQGVVFDWLDRKLGTDARVTMIPYPIQFGDYWENVSYWWNVEFWNASVREAVVYESAFTGTPETFPTIELTFDRSTGHANISPSDYLVQGVAETRFRLAGSVLGEDRGAALIRTERPWRADWLAFDLYRDGWTIPKVTGTIRVFSTPDQAQPLTRFLTLYVRGPRDVPSRGFRVVSNASDWRGRADARGTSNQISVCVPPRGFADVRIEAPHYSPIYGDPRSEDSFFSYARSGGVLLTGIALADETAPC